MRHNPTMPKIRPLLALGFALLVPFTLRADGPTPEPAPAPAVEPPTEAEVTLDEAIKKVRDLKTVKAEVAQTAEMLGQRFTIKGRYLKGQDRRMRLELTVSGLGDSAGQMVQACDGETLWDFQRVQEGSRCTKLSINEIIKRLDAPEFDDAFRQQVLGGMGFAGPEALLAGLRKSIHFDRKEAGSLDIQAEGGKTESIPVWVLKGDWKDREALTSPGQPAFPATGPLPPYVPSQATIYLGKDDGWPYKVQMDGRARSIMMQPRTAGPNRPVLTKPGPAANERPSRLVLLYGNVLLNPTFGPADFFFAPPSNVNVIDQTKDLVDRLERKRSELEEVGKKKAEVEKDNTTPEVPVPRLDKDKAGG